MSGKRVQTTGDLFHCKVPEGAVYVGRAAPGLKASPYRNPFTVKMHGNAALTLYAEYLDRHPELVERARIELAGRDLACWCRVGSACHGDELLRRVSDEV